MEAPQRFIQLISEGKLKEVKEWLIEASYGDCDNASDIRIETDEVSIKEMENIAYKMYCLQKWAAMPLRAHKIEGQEKYIAYDYYLDA